MDPIRGDSTYRVTNSRGIAENITATDFTEEQRKNAMNQLMHQNLIFDTVTNKRLWYTYFNRFGWINLLDTDQITREYLFFTKPDLYIYNGTSYNDAKLNSVFSGNAFFEEADQRHKDGLLELQYHILNPSGRADPFMHYFSNCCISRMDLSGIAAESNKSTTNVYGTGIDYRSHSLRSDYAFDFALTFRDTAYLDIYTIAKAYDEYMRSLKLGEIKFYVPDLQSAPNSDEEIARTFYRENYIYNHIIPEQFSIYKFLVGSDGETILYYAKATGVYITDVPRAEFSDPANDGFKYSLSFHANFVEDTNPQILREFNTLSIASSKLSDFLPVATSEGINNEPAMYARIFKCSEDKRVDRRGTKIDYRLKWTNVHKTEATVRSVATTIKNTGNWFINLFSR